VNLRALCAAILLFSPSLRVVAVTFNGATTYQVIDGFGVNANHRSWNNDELKPVLDALIDQAGMTLFRVVYDDTNWETNNDNSDPNVMNWDYYAPLYSNTEFTRLWDLVGYLNGKGITTNGIIFSFMGPGPAWMGGGSLAAGQESDWAEMITSLLRWARYTNGLQFTYVGPDNEPDLANEGITITSASQYVTALRALAQKLDANGLGDVRLVGPDRSSGGTTYMPEMLADATVMGKLGHFGVHSYSDGGTGSSGVYTYLQASAYPDRTFWVTEFNVWCPTCDSGTRGTYDWAYCKGPADYLLNHLANNASGGIVWEAYDSFYVHPPTAWSFWGLFSVDDEHLTPKIYTARKHFYTLSQISKFVRPGAQRIGVSGSTSTFSPLLAFKHSGAGQVTLVGINTSSGAATLSGSLASLPTLSSLDLYYTSASANLAYGGSVEVANQSFSATIPADCVFTLTGFNSITLTNGILSSNGNAGVGTNVEYYHYTATSAVARVQFDILGPTSDLTLMARKGALPQPDLGQYDYISDNPGTNDERIIVLTNSSPVALSAGDWFVAAINASGAPVTYAIKATQWAQPGRPIDIDLSAVQGDSLCITWSSLPGVEYYLVGATNLSDGLWIPISPIITATTDSTVYCVPLSSPYHVFRVVEGKTPDAVPSAAISNPIRSLTTGAATRHGIL
jgi:O-glycosyl hydrolase